MALPGFYNQGDQEIYASGDKFIPQERYRLGYTAPPSIANAATGITNTQAASPYKWPPLMGGTGDNSGLHNVYGYDPNKTKTFSKQVWSKTGPTEGWTTQDVTGYLSPSGWKTAKGKNINHAGLEVPTLMGTLMDKWAGIKSGEKQVGDIKGTFTDSNWFGQQEEEDPIAVAALRRNLLNKIKAKAYTGPVNVGGGGQDIDPTDPTGDVITRGSFEGDHPDAPTRTPEPGGWHPGVGGADSGSGSGNIGGAGGSVPPSMRAQGGRIGYNRGRVVNPGGYAGEKSEIIEWDPNLLDLEISGIKGSEIMDSWKQQIKKLRYEILQAEKPEFEGMWSDEGLAFNKSQLENLENKFKGGIFDKNPENAFPPEKGSKLNPLNWFAEGGRASYFDGGIARLL